MIGVTFFHLLPVTNTKIKQSLLDLTLIKESNNFPFGNVIIIIVFITILIITNYFYNCNSSTIKINKLSYRNRT